MSIEHQPIHETRETLSSTESLKSPEKSELTSEQIQDQAETQHEQLEVARQKLEQQPAPVPQAEHKAPSHHPTRLDKEASYWDTLRSVQRHLSPVQKRFSQVIHNPVVDKTSAVIEVTIARPSVLLGATSTALLLGGFLYIMARVNGFSLSGSEFIFSLLVGGILGLAVEGLAKLIQPRRRH